MYRSPKLYTLMLQTIHGKYLDRRYREIASIVNNRRVFGIGCGPALLGEYIVNTLEKIDMLGWI